MRIIVLIAGLGFAAASSAEGQSTCNNATPISGIGSFPYAGSPVALGLPGPGLPCSEGSQGTMGANIFFAWTATQTGPHQIDNCGEDVGQSFLDGVLAVYQGSDCSATCIEVSQDGNCGDSELINLSAVAGQTYLIQRLEPDDGRPLDVRLVRDDLAAGARDL